MVTPVEFVLKNDKQTVLYVPMLQTLLSNGDILDKVMSPETNLSQLTWPGIQISQGLYIDLFEVSNPFGNSRKKHKLCAIYWVLGNLYPKYCSSLHSIQLSLLCKVNNIKDYGYSVSLEQHRVYVEQIGASIKGTVLFVAADNLAAHSLGGFFESFTASQTC